jgi:CheY-like chemotaxis protein
MLETVSNSISERTSCALRDRLKESGRILIVDDNVRGAEITARSLAQSYRTVDHVSSAREALSRIDAAQKSREPYDAIVLDLLMPEMDGLTLLTKLEGEPPAVVIHTASIMAPSVLHLDGKVSEQTDLQRVFVHQKEPGSFDLLRGKIDAAVELQRASPGAAAAFFRSFRPRLVEREPGVEEVHNFCEEARNLVSELGAMLKYLRDEHRLGESVWWSGAGRTRLEAAITLVGGARFTNVWKGTPGGTDSAVHDILNIMALELSPPPIAQIPGAAQNNRTQALVAEWENMVTRYYGICRGLREGFGKQYGEEFFFEEFLPAVWPSAIEAPEPEYFGDVTTRAPVVDPERRVRNFLKDLLKEFDAVTKNVAESNPRAQLQFVPERIRIGEDLEDRTRLERIGAGSYWRLTVSADEIDLESALAGLAPKIAQFIAHKEAALEFSMCAGRSFFTLYFKSAASTVDLGAEEAAIAREMLRKKEDGSFTIPRDRSGRGTWVCEGLGEKQNIVCVYNNPQNRAEEKWFGPMIYRYGDAILYSDYMGHPLSAQMIVEYIRHLRTSRGEALEKWGERTAEELVYREGIRIHRNDEADFIVDAWDESDEEAVLAIDTLKNLGVAASKIRVSAGAFAPKLDPLWFAKNRAIDEGSP